MCIQPGSATSPEIGGNGNKLAKAARQVKPNRRFPAKNPRRRKGGREWGRQVDGNGLGRWVAAGAAGRQVSGAAVGTCGGGGIKLESKRSDTDESALNSSEER